MSRDVDYYDLLGVARDASEADIRERFRAIAREAHPDRAPKERRMEAEARFQELAEAVNVLTNAERRKNYDFERSMVVSTSAGSQDSDAIAQNYVAQGIVAYKEQKYADAAGNFALAVHRNPKDVRAQHYLGLASARAGDLRTAVRALETAIAIEPQNVRLLKDAGTIFRRRACS